MASTLQVKAVEMHGVFSKRGITHDVLDTLVTEIIGACRRCLTKFQVKGGA